MTNSLAAPVSANERIEFLDELPRLPTGKLYKRKLRDQYWSERTSKI